MAEITLKPEVQADERKIHEWLRDEGYHAAQLAEAARTMEQDDARGLSNHGERAFRERKSRALQKRLAIEMPYE